MFCDPEIWVLVAGTGSREQMSPAAVLVSEEVGAMVANSQLGLVTGGWPGVDEIVMRSFVRKCEELGIDPNRSLVQFVASNEVVRVDAGQIVRVETFAEEWLGPQSYSNALVIIGGMGGSYAAFLGALQAGLPRFPIFATGGDAGGAHRQMDEFWPLLGNPGMTRAEHRALGRNIESRDDARQVAETLRNLILSCADRDEGEGAQRSPMNVFLSYSLADSVWLGRLRAVLRPLERAKVLRSFADTDLAAGQDASAEVARRIDKCDVGVVLVSASFLASDSLVESQLVRLLERANAQKVRLLWVLVGPCFWQATELARTSPVVRSGASLEEMTPAAAQVALVDVARELVKIRG